METYSVEFVRALEAYADVRVMALPGRADGRPPSAAALLWFGVKTAIRLLFAPPRADVLHGGDMAVWPLVWVGSLRRRAAMQILSAHGTDLSLAARSGLRARLYAAYLGLAQRLSPRLTVFANSRATGELARRLGFARIKSSPLGVRADPPDAMRNDLADGGRYVLFAGRLIKRKGCAWFIREVLPHLPDDVTLKVAGVALEADEADALTAPRVEFLGPVRGAALSRLRRDAVCVITPNIAQNGAMSFEGFGLVALEAAAASGLALASRLDGLEDAVVDGETGFLLPPGDAEAWAAKIAEILAWTPTARAAFVENSLRICGDRYSWSRVAKDALDAYADGAFAH